MGTNVSSSGSESVKTKKFIRALGRAAGGSVIFSLPILMTMEMWHLGFYMSRIKLLTLLIMTLPLLIQLSRLIGFEKTRSLSNDILDAFVAYAIAFISSGFILWLFSVLDFTMPLEEILGKIIIQAVPASIGALLAQGQFGSSNDKKEEEQRTSSYGGEIFLMATGALYLAFNLAPTEEMILISYMMNELQAVILMFLSLAIIHIFVYVVEFKGQEKFPEGATQTGVFLRFSIVGYMVVFIISLYVLWIFGRMDGMSLKHIVMAVVVLGFPGSVGAAAARLII